MKMIGREVDNLIYKKCFLIYNKVNKIFLWKKI